MVSKLKVRSWELPKVLTVGGTMNWDTSSQSTIPITETTIQMMRTRRKWRGSAGVGVALGVLPSMLTSDMLHPLNNLLQKSFRPCTRWCPLPRYTLRGIRDHLYHGH